jgi:hypothetical protein
VRHLRRFRPAPDRQRQDHQPVLTIVSAKPLIVTAADQRYWRCLYQFLRDIERHDLQQGHVILAYDLGLAPATRDSLARRFPWVGFRVFRFENHPPHVAMAESSYAWKPLLLTQLVAAETAPILWLDSATLFRTKDLGFLWDIIRREGVYVAHGQTPLRERCDPLTLQALDVPASIRRRPEIAAGVIGLDAAKENIRALVAEWAHHARTEAHIMPRRPRFSWHKPEQALLSILLYREEEAGRLRLGHDEIDVSSGRPLTWMSSRNKVGEEAPLWADPFVRLYHRGYKILDQALWRWRNWRDTRLHGAHRRLKEHFSVLLRDREGRVQRIAAPDGCYYADPFLVTHQNRTALLLERFDYRSCRGDLCAVPLDGDLRPGAPMPILPRARHMSFPYVFAHEDTLYLVPETCGDRTVEIFRCASFPDVWEPVATALDGIDAADTVIFFQDGLWWLVTSVRPTEGGRYLAIWHAEDFRTGPWRPHPVNEQRLYQHLPFSSGRNGGAMLQDGLLLRPMHSNTRFYGEGLALMQVECLTTSEYREKPFTGSHPAAAILADFSPHHLSMAGGLAVFDIRDRARGWGGLRPFARRRPGSTYS